MNHQNALQTNKRPTAIRLVSTKDMSRQEWLTVRNQGIGASDAAAAIGISPYQSRLELWMIKTGRMSSELTNAPDDLGSPMYWGNVLEPIVAEHYSRKTGLKVRRVNSVLQHPDPDKAWMLANLDYAVVGSDDVQILECKTAGEYGARLWQDGVPDYYQCQVQHQLAITGKQVADVAVLICGQEFRIYRIERDDDLIRELIELEREFWQFVETDTPPPSDCSVSADKALRALHPKDNGIAIDLSDDDNFNQVFHELTELRTAAQQLSFKESELKQQIQQRMGDASVAQFATGRINWKKSKDSVSLDTQSLLKAQPDLLQQYPQVRQGSRRFLIQSTSLEG